MVTDALKGYLQLANGLTDVTKDRASSAAKALVAQRPDLVGTAASTAAATALAAAMQAQSFAGDLMVTSRDNRALLIGIIRTEVERAVAALGFAKESEVDAVRHKVDRLEEAVDGLGEDTPFATPTLRAALTPVKKAAPKKVAAKKPVAQKPAAQKGPAKKPVAQKPAAQKGPAKKPVAQKAPVKKAPVKKAVAKQPAPQESVAETAPATPSTSPVSVATTPLPPAAPAQSSPVLGTALVVTPDVVDLTRTDAAAPVGDGNQA